MLRLGLFGSLACLQNQLSQLEELWPRSSAGTGPASSLCAGFPSALRPSGRGPAGRGR